MGFFTRTKTISGQGWTFDKNSGRLTINGDMGDAFDFSDSIDKSRGKVRSIVALKGARVRNGLRLFSDMKNLISADLTELDVSECNIMYEMFAGCESLTTLDLSTWDVSNVEIMAWMFRLCSSLEELDLTSIDVSNVKNLSEKQNQIRKCLQ